MGIAPLTGDSALPLFIYSLVYFAIVILVSLYPGKLLDTVGNFLAPLKIIALVILSVAAIVWRQVLSARRLRLIKTLRFLTASSTAI